MKIREAIKISIKQFKQANIGTYGNDAMILLKTVLKKDEIFILTNPNYKLSDEQEKHLYTLLKKRLMLYPMAYITGKKEFYGLEFLVSEHVLIPRPETEIVVEETIKIAKTINAENIIDIGTGSGCIAITVSNILNKKVLASDISKSALYVAKLNRDRHKAKVDFILSNGIDWIGKKVDIIVSNPPYVSKEDYLNLSKDVKYEPKEALISEDDGLSFIKYLIEHSKSLTKYLILEFGYNQSPLIRSQNYLLKILKDLSGIDRVAVFKFF